MPPKEWRSVGIPTELYLAIEPLLDETVLGYRSVGEFVREATRNHYLEIIRTGLPPRSPDKEPRKDNDNGDILKNERGGTHGLRL